MPAFPASSARNPPCQAARSATSGTARSSLISSTPPPGSSSRSSGPVRACPANLTGVRFSGGADEAVDLGRGVRAASCKSSSSSASVGASRSGRSAASTAADGSIQRSAASRSCAGVSSATCSR